MKRLLAVMFFLCFSASISQAQSKPNLVKAELLADVSAIKPGETFHLGVLLDIEPGWHVYWQNPGDSGRATTVKFHAPDGFKVGELTFPVPIQFNQPGDIIGYGYEKRLLLTAEVTAPKDLKSGTKTSISADVIWLCCKSACIPGKAKVSIDLKVAEKSKPANEALFKEWSARFPIEKDSAVKSSSLKTDEAAGTFTHTIEWNTPPKKVELYPSRDEAVEVANVDVKTDGARSVASFTARLWSGQKTPESTLPLLLVYTDAKDVRHGVWLSIPTAGIKEAKQ